MDNRILHIRLEDRSLDPVSAEVWIEVTPQCITPTTEVRGRLMGPSCPYASTVEIAYPLTPLRPEHLVPGVIRQRVVIPEASLWDTQAPHLYAGPVELWQDGRRCDRVEVRHGLRQLCLGPRGLSLNGRSLRLKGRSCEACFPDQALALRREGCNALLIPVSPGTLATWDVADRYGFLVIGRLPPPGEELVPLLQALSRRPCCFGWIVGPEWFPGEWLERLAQAHGPFAGVEGGHDAAHASPDVQFVAGRRDQLPALAESRLPVLILQEPGAPPEPSDNFPLLLGQIELGPLPPLV
jgi:hypothetical protein